MSILIVESPAKCKKIQSFLDKSYIVKSSVGHIRSLDTKWANTDIEINDDFEPPFVVIKDKQEVIRNLKNYSKGRKVILAADDDREGEAIAWHCGDILNVNFNDNNRIIFREITKKAILNALNNPTKLNMNEVNAQKARSVIDLLIGYKLSPCLWANITTKERGLSAGRVQSALLKLLYDKEKEINEYESEYTFDIQGKFKDLSEKSEFEFTCDDEPDEDYIKNLFKLFSEDRIFKVSENKKSEEKKYPDKPFITSSLQQDAQKSFGFNVKKTMGIAQKLYENGLITYMRTDSTIVSEDFQRLLNNKITDNYGQEYFNSPKVKKVKGSQEAHECIRPTQLDVKLDEEKFEKDDIKLYNLINDRTIKSHMKPAIYNVNSIKLCNSNTKDKGHFTSKQKEIKFKGYLIYKENQDKQNKLVEFKNEYKLLECSCYDKCSQPPEPYNESAIVKLLENTGIGRPSTYASIISTLYNRNYTLTKTIKLDDYTEDYIHLDKKDNITDKVNKIKGKTMKNKIVVTELGNKVLNYLDDKFHDIIHKDFTAGVESDLDKISNGELVWTDIINKVYNSFLPIVLREIGNKVKKPKNILGEYKGKEVQSGTGQYGPYILYNKKFTNVDKYLKSNKKTLDELTIEDCKIILKYPIKINKDIQIMLGPYGTYMKYNGKNYKIKQDIDYTEEYCLSVINK